MALQVLEIVPTAYQVDSSSISYPDNVCDGISNIDFYAGSARSIPNLVNLISYPAAFVPNAMQYYTDGTQGFMASAGSTGVWVLATNGTMYDVTPPTGLSGANYWDVTSFGKWLIVTNDTIGEVPHALSASSPVSTTNLAPLPNFPTDWESTLIRTHRNVLWIANTIEAGIAYTNRVRWSTSAPTDALPASWVPTASNDAGQNDLEFQGGRINDLAACGDVMFISGNGGLYAARWIGGQYTYRFSKVLDQGARGLRCMEAINNNTVCMLTDNDIVLATESDVKSIGVGRVTDLVRRMVTAEMMYIPATRQVVIAYSLGGEVGYNHILTWDIETNTYGNIELVDYPATALGVGPWVVTRPSTAWQDLTWTWQDWPGTWYLAQPLSRRNYTANADGIYATGAKAATWSLRRTNLPVPEGETVRIVAVEVEIDGEQGDLVTIRAGVSQYASQAVNWANDKTYVVGEQDLRNDIGLTGKYISYAAGGNAACNITRLRFYYEPRAIKP